MSLSISFSAIESSISMFHIWYGPGNAKVEWPSRWTLGKGFGGALRSIEIVVESSSPKIRPIEVELMEKIHCTPVSNSERCEFRCVLHTSRGQHNHMCCWLLSLFQDEDNGRVDTCATHFATWQLPGAFAEVWLPDWLRNRESQLAGFVHPGTADGLMKATLEDFPRPSPSWLTLIKV